MMKIFLLLGPDKTFENSSYALNLEFFLCADSYSFCAMLFASLYFCYNSSLLGVTYEY
jgi:hypothetical protein